MSSQVQSLPHHNPALRFAVAVAVVIAGFLLMRVIASGTPGASEVRGLFGPVFAFLAAQPFVLVFFTVAGGYALGKVKVGPIQLGATAATLVLCLTLSLWAGARGVKIEISDFASTLMFNLFMFAVGMKVGPQFLSGLRREARAFISLGVLVPLLSAGLMIGVGKIFKLEPGLMPGILAGANTATPGIGAAKDVYLARFGEGSAALANLSTAFAFGYCLSLVVFVVMMKLMPRWFGNDVVADARAYQREIERGGTSPLPGTSESMVTAGAPLEVRAFQVEQAALVGRTVGSLFQPDDELAIERVLRAEVELPLDDRLPLALGDVIVVSGPLESVVRAGGRVGRELANPSLLAVGIETFEVVAVRGAAIGKQIGELRRTSGRGLVLNALFRGGEEIPFGAETLVQKGDVLRLTGSKRRVEALQKRVGAQLIRPQRVTDMVTLAMGLAVGATLGAITFTVFGLTLSLGSAVGPLIAGIVLSSVRTRRPGLGGPFPEPARQLIEDLGLNVFIAITALNAGAGVLAAVKGGAMVPIIVGTLVVGMIPPVIGWAFGQYRHRMNSGLLTGAVAGARCSSPGLRIAQENTRSSVPALSYPVTFAVSNVLVTLTCYLMATMD